MEIRRYNPVLDEASLFAMMRDEGEDWTSYSVTHREQYQTALTDSITYVGYEEDTICGYLRCRDDSGFGIYIYDLLVKTPFRGKGYGRLLMEQVYLDFPGNVVYVMSDVDCYYEKLGYSREGSIFIVNPD